VVTTSASVAEGVYPFRCTMAVGWHLDSCGSSEEGGEVRNGNEAATKSRWIFRVACCLVGLSAVSASAQDEPNVPKGYFQIEGGYFSWAPDETPLGEILIEPPLRISVRLNHPVIIHPVTLDTALARHLTDGKANWNTLFNVQCSIGVFKVELLHWLSILQVSLRTCSTSIR